jgi:hypothetical protein
MTAFAAVAASASNPVTPKLGRYYGQTEKQTEPGVVEVHETEVKVVRIGKRRGALVRMSEFAPTSCTGDQMPGGFYVSTPHPIPIENGEFKSDRTGQLRLAAGAGTGTLRTVISGTFESPTKVVVKASVNFSFSVQFPGQPESKGTCTGKQTGIARPK